MDGGRELLAQEKDYNNNCHERAIGLRVPRLGRDAIARPGLRQHAGLAHQPRDPMLPTGEAEGAQLHPDPRTAVAPLHLPLNLADLLGQDAIGFHAIAQRPRTPGVVTGPRHLQHPAHRGHAPDAGMRLDKGESHRLSLAKKAVAFFRISRSSRSRSFSRLSSALALPARVRVQGLASAAPPKRLRCPQNPGNVKPLLRGFFLEVIREIRGSSAKIVVPVVVVVVVVAVAASIGIEHAGRLWRTRDRSTGSRRRTRC